MIFLDIRCGNINVPHNLPFNQFALNFPGRKKLNYHPKSGMVCGTDTSISYGRSPANGFSHKLPWLLLRYLKPVFMR